MFTAIIPTKNRLKELTMCVTSLLSQEEINEVIIIDNSDVSYYEQDEEFTESLMELLRWKGVIGTFLRSIGEICVTDLRLLGAERAINDNLFFIDDDSIYAGDNLKHFDRWFKDTKCPFVAIGMQDILNTGEFKDWSIYPEKTTDFFAHKRDYGYPIKYDLGIFRSYENTVSTYVPYCAGTMLTTKSWLHLFRDAAEIFGVGCPREDIYITSRMSLESNRFGWFSSKYFVYHNRLRNQFRKWDKDYIWQPELLEVVTKVQEMYEKHCFSEPGVRITE